MDSTSSLSWQFAGWPLAAAALGGTAMLAWFYTRTLRTLPPRARRVLTALRLGFWTLVILLLANPTRIERTTLDTAAKRPLAVIADSSDSMTTPDNRGRTRLQEASRRWPALEKTAKAIFSRLDFFSFSKSLKPAAGLMNQGAGGGKETRLYESLAALLEKSPELGGVICFTDGLDTTGQAPEALIGAAVSKRVPLYFVPGGNRLRPSEFLAIRETSVPPQVRRRSQFEWRAVIEAYSLKPRTVPISLWRDEMLVTQGTIQLSAGQTVATWKTPVVADESGLISYEMRVGEGDTAQFGNATVRVVDKTAVPILYYQGALDWGFPFLANVLRRDPSFTLHSIFNPSLGESRRTGQEDLPSSVEALRAYQLVVLANVFASQLSPAQQDALGEYVRGGGGVLFLTPDGPACQAFAGTKIEEMLPVAFEKPAATGPETETTASRFAAQMQTSRGADPFVEDQFARGAEAEMRADPLRPFVLTAAGARLPIFRSPESRAEILPRFSDFSSIARAKPGAEILAVTSKKNPHILLATQFFGKGLAAVLASDSLWRWKLSLPSGAREAETFWQQLLLWFARGPLQGIHFEQIPAQLSFNETQTLKLAGAEGAQTPSVSIRSPSGKSRAVAVEAGGGPEQWLVRWQPDEAGLWKIEATDGRGRALAKIHVSAEAKTRELSNLPPAFDALRRLAEATGGELIVDDQPSGWLALAHPNQSVTISEARQPIWDRWPLLLGGLGFYVAELIYRRRMRLL